MITRHINMVTFYRYHVDIKATTIKSYNLFIFVCHVRFSNYNIYQWKATTTFLIYYVITISTIFNSLVQRPWFDRNMDRTITKFGRPILGPVKFPVSTFRPGPVQTWKILDFTGRLKFPIFFLCKKKFIY